jgi:DNA-binding winged helix-turn-helix (wHTH) protein
MDARDFPTMSAEPHARLPKSPEPRVQGLRFGPFEMDLSSGELFQNGSRVKLQLQPFRVLALLARHPGQLLTRDEIQREIWPDGTFVDFEQALNFCIRQIRSALGDQAATPRYIETLPRRGYRFIGLVEPVAPPSLARITPPLGLPVAVVAPADLLEPEPPPESVPTPPPAPVAAVATAPRARARIALLVLAGAALGALATALALGRNSAPPHVPVYQRITFGRGATALARFGPDGQVLYTAAWEGGPMRIYSVRPDALDPRPLELPGQFVVGTSPRGEVALLGPNGLLQRVPLAGGPVKPVLERVRSADWALDGGEFAIARSLGEEHAIEFPIGTRLTTAFQPTHLRISPDQTKVAFLEHPQRGDDRGDVVVVDRAGKRRVLSGTWASVEGLAWTPDSKEVWFTAAEVGGDSALRAVTLDGEARMVAPALGRLVLRDIAPDGRVLLARSVLRLEMRFAGEDGVERDLSWLDMSRVAALSPDGRSLLFLESGEGGGPDYAIYLRGTDGALPVRVGPGRPMGLSPDGRHVLAIPLRTPDRLDLLPVGAGEPLALRDASVLEYEWAGFVGDGRQVAFTGRTAAGRRVYVREVAGSSPARAITPVGVTPVTSSPLSSDGRWLVAACAPDKPAPCLYPVDGTGAPRPLPDFEGGVIGWAGNDALFVARGGLPLYLDRLDLATGRRTPFRTLNPAERSGVLRYNSVVATPDGRHVAYSYARQASDLYVVKGLR